MIDGMGRGKTRLALTAAELAQLKEQLRQSTGARDSERLRVLLRAAQGRHTLDNLAHHAGRARSTIQVWVEKFKQGGVAGLLARDAPPGSTSPIAARRVQRQLRAGIKSGRWKTASAVAAWLKREHGIARPRKSLYYWLKKINGEDAAPAHPSRRR